MSLEAYQKKTVTTRKPHDCVYCGGAIPADTPNVEYEHGVYDGKPFSRYACAECAPYLDEFWDYMGGECGNFLTDWDEFMNECHPELVEDPDAD